MYPTSADCDTLPHAEFPASHTGERRTHIVGASLAVIREKRSCSKEREPVS
jgi:hypothetical protein